MDSQQESEIIKLIFATTEAKGVCNIKDAAHQILFYNIPEKAQEELADKVVKTWSYKKIKMGRDWVILKSNVPKEMSITAKEIKGARWIVHIVIALATLGVGGSLAFYNSQNAKIIYIEDAKNHKPDTALHILKDHKSQ